METSVGLWYRWASAASVVMQDDGNLVVYDADGTYLWGSAPDGRPGAYVTMQDHGNLVVYTPDREAPWASDTVWISALPSAPTLISLAPDRHEMFQQGIDAALMHRSFANGSWGDWASLVGRSGVGRQPPSGVRAGSTCSSAPGLEPPLPLS
jgi:hypothetical protein